MTTKAQYVIVALVLSQLIVFGCSKPPRGGPRVKTHPATGIVNVDGSPQEAILVECYPEPGGTIQRPLAGHTDAEGKFVISTYESGDGLPAGEYALTFKWMVSQGLTAVDKFKGAYSDPKKSEYKVTVIEDQPIDLGVIELKTQ